jgi:hypothetical protein
MLSMLVYVHHSYASCGQSPYVAIFHADPTELSPPCATAVTDGALELPVVAMGGIGGRSGSSLSVRDSLPPVVYIVDAIILNSCSVRPVGSEFQSHARRHCSAAIASDAVNLFKQ